ncbi:hypothetical protein B0H14DRAFT_1628906 [Mycena olivaceomarginata]|nr:hypothetical protein B0H14DRAFT_1628906 [Mycena olivaceomarginata]
MTTRSPSLSSFSSSSSPNESRSFPPYAPLQVPIVVHPACMAMLFILGLALWPLWLTVICGPDGNGGLWLWEEEDEEGIREFAITNELLSVSPTTEENWNEAFQALEARLSRTIVITSPLAHLPPQTRLRFIAWLLVAGPLKKDYMLQNGDNRDNPGIAMVIDTWAQVTDPPLTGGTCDVCKVSGILPVWIETMLEVYSLDDLRLLSRDHECNCLHSQLTATANTYLERGVPETPLGRNSPVFHVLYELVVRPWPLFLWVVYPHWGK